MHLTALSVFAGTDRCAAMPPARRSLMVLALPKDGSTQD